MGEDNLRRGIALYTSRNAHRLVDSHDFERAMEEASGRDLHGLFEEGVYRRLADGALEVYPHAPPAETTSGTID